MQAGRQKAQRHWDAGAAMLMPRNLAGDVPRRFTAGHASAMALLCLPDMIAVRRRGHRRAPACGSVACVDGPRLARIFLRVAWSLAVMCPAYNTVAHGPLAVMGSAD
jgi:hypothetical protein